MYKIQQLHDHLVNSGIVSKGKISIYVDQGEMEWVFSPNDNSFELNYTADILLREFSKKVPIHLLFFTLGSFFDQYDAARHNNFPTFETNLLNQAETDLRFKVKFNEEYEYDTVDTVEEADISVSNLYPGQEGEIHLKLRDPENETRIYGHQNDGLLIRLHQLKDHEHDL